MILESFINFYTSYTKGNYCIMIQRSGAVKFLFRTIETLKGPSGRTSPWTPFATL
jgi:hypothetical protein